MELIRVVDEDGNDTDEVLEREDVHIYLNFIMRLLFILLIKRGKYFFREGVRIEDFVLICLVL